MSRLTKEPTAPFNPFYGCAIMAMAIMIFGGIVTWSAYSFMKQDSDIAKFAVDQPVKLAPTKLSDADVPALKAKLTAFADSAKAAKPATLTLTVPELNTLMELAPDIGAGGFKDMIAIKAVKPDSSLIADVCLPMNKAKFWEGGKRYAVGEATFAVEIVKETGPDLRMTDLTIPGKTINPDFIQAFSSWNWLTPYHKLAALTPVMKAVKKVSVTAEGVVLSTE